MLLSDVAVNEIQYLPLIEDIMNQKWEVLIFHLQICSSPLQSRNDEL